MKNKTSFKIYFLLSGLLLSNICSGSSLEELLTKIVNKDKGYEINIYKAASPFFNTEDWKKIEAQKEYPEGSGLIPCGVKVPSFPFPAEDYYNQDKAQKAYHNFSNWSPSVRSPWNSSQKTLKFFYDNKVAYVAFPKDSKLCPGVVILHGSEGSNIDFYGNYMRALKEQGIASILIDRYFGIVSKDKQKFITDTLIDQLTLTLEQETIIAFYAGQLLQTHPRLKGQEIGIWGWSRGATVALNCLDPKHIKSVSPNFQFSAYIGYYPLPLIQEKTFAPKTPLFLIYGEEDTYTPFNVLKDYLEYWKGEAIKPEASPSSQASKDYKITKEGSALIKVRTYSNAGHMFDGNFEYFLSERKMSDSSLEESIPHVQNFSKACVRVSERDPNGFIPVGEDKVYPWSDFLSHLAKKTTLGATSKINNFAGQDAWKTSLDFLKHNLGVKQKKTS